MFQKRACLLQFVRIAILAAVFGAGQAPKASLLRAMSLGELANAADRIVVGSVIAVNAAWDPQHRKIISTIEVDIEESWKGQVGASRRIAIVQPGGSVGEMEMTVHGMPSFSIGEKSVLFLQGQNRYQVVGMSQGKRGLAWDETSKQWLAQAPDPEGMVEVGPGAKLHQAQRGVSIPLSDLRAQVRRAIGKTP